jgi:hypothetical protein
MIQSNSFCETPLFSASAPRSFILSGDAFIDPPSSGCAGLRRERLSVPKMVTNETVAAQAAIFFETKMFFNGTDSNF